MTETVSCEIVLGDGRPWRGHVPVLRLSWSAGDPLAVVLVVGARPPHPSLLRGRWVVPVSYKHQRAHQKDTNLVCRLQL
jgi:hypothetical protein